MGGARERPECSLLVMDLGYTSYERTPPRLPLRITDDDTVHFHSHFRFAASGRRLLTVSSHVPGCADNLERKYERMVRVLYGPRIFPEACAPQL